MRIKLKPLLNSCYLQNRPKYKIMYKILLKTKNICNTLELKSNEIFSVEY